MEGKEGKPNPQNKMQQIEYADKTLIHDFAKIYEKQLKDDIIAEKEYYDKKNLIMGLDPFFLDHVKSKLFLSFLGFNALLVSFYTLKLQGMQRWKRFSTISLLGVVGNSYILHYWLNYYPLREFSYGRVKYVYNNHKKSGDGYS